MRDRVGAMPRPGSDLRRCAVWSALCLFIASACATAGPPQLPPLTPEPTGLVKPGKFVWVDLVTDDVAKARSFYGALFGWTFHGDDDGCVEVLQDGAPIACIVPLEGPRDGLRHSSWVGNLSVVDVDRAAALVAERGGRVASGPLDAPDRGRLALVTDPSGAVLLLTRSTGGDPPDREPVLSGWLWRELWTQDVESALAFYSELGGYQRETIDLDGRAYHLLKQGEALRAGVVLAPDDVKPLWLPYVRVEDPAGIAARAEHLGGRVVVQDDDAAILIDPTGAAIGVQTWTGRRTERSR